jgi:hypothetical protein
MAKGQMGRDAVFRGKNDGVRVQGVLTKAGGDAFEMRRVELLTMFEQIIGRPPTNVSDADTIEFMAVGERATRKRLLELRQELGV